MYTYSGYWAEAHQNLDGEELLQSTVQIVQSAGPLVAVLLAVQYVLRSKKMVLHFTAPIAKSVPKTPVPHDTTKDMSPSSL